MLSVHKGLKEAGQAMGLPFHKILFHIIGPVAFRRMIPPLGNQCIISLKDSSLFIVIGVAELTRQGQEIMASNFRAVEIWSAIAIVYLILTSTMALILQTLFEAGDQVWMEDPGYPPTRALLEQARLKPVPVPVDQDGIMVGAGIERAGRARGAVVTPAHQSPLSMSLSLPRRQALLDWAERCGAWIVEDDYDGEYRYVGRPLPALKSLDTQGRVLYAGTFSKVLFPGLRLAYLVVPEAQAGRFAQSARLQAGAAPGLTQAILSAFMAEGHFGRHIQRMRKLYAERRAATVAGLNDALEQRLRIEPQPGGMHLVARLEDGQSDVGLAGRMEEQGMYAGVLSRWHAAPQGQSALLLSFTNIATQAQARELGLRILQLMQS
ncbi:DNA-binding protein [Achromobacter xylosoxidans]|nr:DNA-binding protein [Achromobacter xylosoxidans]